MDKMAVRATGIDLRQASLAEVATALQEGCITSEWLVNQYLDNIARDTDHYNAVFETMTRESAAKAAQALDDERQSGKSRGPLHGIPILVKDHLGTGPDLGLSTTAGATPLIGSSCPSDAPIIHRLRDAGAIILGKASMTIMHNIYNKSMKSSWNPRLGLAKGVFDHKRPGGSSSGPAVGLAAGFGAASVGAEISGSLVYPASLAGLFALKPTVGLISDGNRGSISISDSFDAAGPMGKSVTDLAMMLDAMVGEDDKGSGGRYLDAVSSGEDTQVGENARSAAGSARRRFKVAVLPPIRDPDETEERFEKTQAIFKRDIALLQGDDSLELVYEFDDDRPSAGPAGSDTTFTLPESLWDIRDSDRYDRYRRAGKLIQTVDMYNNLTSFLSTLRFPEGMAEIRTPEEFVQALKSMDNPHVAESGTDGSMTHLDAMLRYKGDTSMAAYGEAKSLFESIKTDMMSYMEHNDLDAIVGPMRLCVFSCVSGHPVGTLPTGLDDDDMPSHVLVLGRPGAERELLSIMSKMESDLPARPMPPVGRDTQSTSSTQ